MKENEKGKENTQLKLKKRIRVLIKFQNHCNAALN
jgi:hypothetical protein